MLDTIRLHNDDKIRCVLNKSDCVTREQLVRVYGSLLWSMGECVCTCDPRLFRNREKIEFGTEPWEAHSRSRRDSPPAGKIFDSPEVVRVYLGSFWNGALIHDDFKRVFEKDERLLVRELVDLPRCAAERKVNQMVSRIRLVKVHVCLLGALSRMTPLLFGKGRSRARIMADLDSIMDGVRVEFDLSRGDMPDPGEFARCLDNFPDLGVFPPTDRDLIEKLDLLIEREIPNIISEAESVRLGRRVVVRERGGNEPVDQATIVRVQSFDQNRSTLGIRRLLGKAVFFCILALSLAEGVHLWSFSRPAYSLIELHDGCRNLVNAELDRPYVSEVRSKVATLFHRDPSPTPDAGSEL